MAACLLQLTPTNPVPPSGGPGCKNSERTANMPACASFRKRRHYPQRRAAHDDRGTHGSCLARVAVAAGGEPPKNVSREGLAASSRSDRFDRPGPLCTTSGHRAQMAKPRGRHYELPAWAGRRSIRRTGSQIDWRDASCKTGLRLAYFKAPSLGISSLDLGRGQQRPFLLPHPRGPPTHGKPPPCAHRDWARSAAKGGSAARRCVRRRETAIPEYLSNEAMKARNEPAPMPRPINRTVTRHCDRDRPDVPVHPPADRHTIRWR